MRRWRRLKGMEWLGSRRGRLLGSVLGIIRLKVVVSPNNQASKPHPKNIANRFPIPTAFPPNTVSTASANPSPTCVQSAAVCKTPKSTSADNATPTSQLVCTVLSASRSTHAPAPTTVNNGFNASNASAKYACDFNSEPSGM